jgi:CelD/BcsL family acetyltransferase involved in cellulose biosynthesis
MSAAVGRWDLRLIRGWNAVRAFVTSEREAEWRRLAEEAKHVAVYQAPAFVLSWYETYASCYEPLLLLGLTPAGDILGVMPLARARGGAERLVFAGAEHCEYAGWLAAPALEEDFPARAVAHLHEADLFGRPWRWGWLAPGLSTAWLDHRALRARSIAPLAEVGRTPLLALQGPARPRFFDAGGKNHRRKANRLRRLGPLRLERLGAESLSDGLLRRLTTAYDIRTLARYGSAPFSDDPLKAPFHRRLVGREPDTALLYVLWAGEEAVAFAFLLGDRRRAMYCLGAFDHRWLDASPGKLIGDLVADDLAGRGFEHLDHTPGGDPYKEEAATTHEALTRLVLFPGRTGAGACTIRCALQARARALALTVGLRPERLREAATRYLSLARGRSAMDLARAAGRAALRWVRSRQVVAVFRLDRAVWEGTPGDGTSGAVAFSMDRPEDLLLYTGSNRWCPRQALMATALERLREGEHCYTVVEDGVLLHYGWINPSARELHVTEVDRRIPLPEGSALVYDGYTEPGARGRGLHTRSLQYRVAECFRLGARSVTTSALESNPVSVRNIQRVFGRPVGRVVQVRRLGRVRSWEEPA